MCDIKPDIVAIIETKLRCIENATVFPGKFNKIRKDRDREDGGDGVALLVRDGIDSEDIEVKLDLDLTEFVLRKLKLKTEELIVLVMYIPTRRQGGCA